MPWKPRVAKSEVRAALEEAESWRQVLDALGYGYHGKNIATVRKWAARWGISTDHLTDNRGGRWGHVRYSEDELKSAIAASFSWAETLRRLGYCPTGGNWKTVQKRASALGIPTDHFDPYATSRQLARKRRIPLEQVLVENSTYSRASLKRRLYESGLKEPRCELCGQDEYWRGTRISLILDHINGVRDDNRLENLRIVCPNCAAGLDTHCGRRTRLERDPRECLLCGTSFVPNRPEQRYCSRSCGSRAPRSYAPRPTIRRVARPPRERLLREIGALGYAGVGREYGVSDNAVRKWIRDYEREHAIAEGRDPNSVSIPRRTWPNRRSRARRGPDADGTGSARADRERPARGRGDAA